MRGLTERIQEDIRGRIRQAVEKSFGLKVEPELTVPGRREFGDYSTNVAFSLAGALHVPPRKIAESIAAALEKRGSWIDAVEVAGAGFLNFKLRNGWCLEGLKEIIELGDDFGKTDFGQGRKVQVEFVSANPTGPMVVVQARAGAVGDTLANLLEWSGFDVEREFYVNDAGHQVEVLARSLEVRIRQCLGEKVDMPEDCYPGEYLIDLARRYLDERGKTVLDLPEEKRLAELRAYAVEAIRSSQEISLRHYGVEFDVWFSERTLHESGEVRAAIELLKQRGYVYEGEGALWFRSTAFGDDKDRVLIKSDGSYTYLAPDIAYHLNKYRRGFEKVIDIWGPDHHGYISRMKAAVQALGYPEDALEVLIVQMVRLVRGGETVRMSKRAGEFVTMDELLEEVGRDVARFFFLMRSCESHLDFDLDLGKLKSDENPVYYVQYAHARISSLLREAQERGIKWPCPVEPDLNLLSDESEVELAKKLVSFPEEIVNAGLAREPHRMTRYLIDTATLFHSFYTRCRILGEDPELTVARLYLSEATRVVLRNGLRLIGVSAPERM
ncbi:MAG TPA: arginine--tRNA ligase [Firmicutes bacterium]|nr:arginine--tRNA ligase [Bacillota bacterium]